MSRSAYNRLMLGHRGPQIPSMVGTIVALQKCPFPNPENYEYGIYHGKRDFAETVKLRIWRWGADAEPSRWAWCNHTSP